MCVLNALSGPQSDENGARGLVASSGFALDGLLEHVTPRWHLIYYIATKIRCGYRNRLAGTREPCRTIGYPLFLHHVLELRRPLIDVVCI
jgi:hypothetical protein